MERWYLRAHEDRHSPTTSLFPRHMLLTLVVDALGRPVGDADAASGKAGAQGIPDAAPPSDLAPSRLGQHRLGRRGKLVGDLVLPRPAAPSDGEDECDVGEIELLVLGDAHGPGEAAPAQVLSKGGGQAVAGIGQP